jgi:hypothetical protein
VGKGTDGKSIVAGQEISNGCWTQFRGVALATRGTATQSDVGTGRGTAPHQRLRLARQAGAG